MRRRGFLLGMAPALLACGPPGRLRINRITIAPIEGRFHKTVAMNSYDPGPKGDTYTTHLLRVFTNQGVSGTGTLDYSRPDQPMLRTLRGLIGADPMAIYQFEDQRIRGVQARYAKVLSRCRFLDSALFDLAGQLLHIPCYELIGPAARDRVEAYDGTLYFSDIMRPEKGVGAVVEEAEEAVRSGYLGMKLKVGRNSKWMPGRGGVDRDIEVVNAVRQAVGPKAKIMADANNGYQGQFDEAWRFLAETQESDLFWIEEIFPQNPTLYARLREKMHRAGMKTLIADGEDMNSAEDLRHYMNPLLIDVTQIDIRRAGLLGNREAAQFGAASGAVCVPHNWGSQIGGLMSLQFSKAVASAVAA
ncbi:MAG: hypothetical protein HY236_13660, partial [Acidobacteria bacterium]|nr:hypothetical protein [Acidobacteriota bacterium]